MNDPNIPVFVGVRAEIILVVVTIDSPVMSYGLEIVRSTVTVRICEFCNFGALGDKK